MNTKTNATAYIGQISEIKNKDDKGSLLFFSTVQPTGSKDSLNSRKLTCMILSQYLDYVDLPAKLRLNLNILNINHNTNNTYNILDLTGSRDAVRSSLKNEINIFDSRELRYATKKLTSTKKRSKAVSKKKMPVQPVRLDRVGFEYTNRIY
jgi:hypothetical protein